MQPIYNWFQHLYDTTGINLPFIYDGFDRARMLRGLWLTIELSVITIVLSVLIGILGAWLQRSNLVWLRRGVAGFISIFRNTPPLVQIYFFYFGLGFVLPRVAGQPLISNFEWAIISLSLFAGAFNIEIFRSGIEAVPSSMIEAAEGLGYSRFQIYRDVLVATRPPQAIQRLLFAVLGPLGRWLGYRADEPYPLTRTPRRPRAA